MTEKRFFRNIGAITTQEQKKIAGSRVFVAGCGGIGGYIIEHLVRIGVGEVICADGGRFEPGNLNRQILADMQTLGREKAVCACERAALINPGAKVRGITAHICEENIAGMVSGCDLAIDALDNVKTRKILFAACKKERIPAIHAAVRGWLVQAAFVPPDGTLYDFLYPENANETPAGVMSFAPGMAAALQAALAVRCLCGRPCGGDLHIYDLLSMDYSRVRL